MTGEQIVAGCVGRVGQRTNNVATCERHIDASQRRFSYVLHSVTIEVVPDEIADVSGRSGPIIGRQLIAARDEGGVPDIRTSGIGCCGQCVASGQRRHVEGCGVVTGLETREQIGPSTRSCVGDASNRKVATSEGDQHSVEARLAGVPAAISIEIVEDEVANGRGEQVTEVRQVEVLARLHGD